jgi:hypothetical protein
VGAEEDLAHQCSSRPTRPALTGLAKLECDSRYLFEMTTKMFDAYQATMHASVIAGGVFDPAAGGACAVSPMARRTQLVLRELRCE